MNDEENHNSDQKRNPDSSGPPWKFRLYINDKTALKSIITLQNFTEICERHLANRYELEVIDLMDNFARAQEDRIMALPTLVRRSPGPVCKIIGDLSNPTQVITALGLHGNDLNKS